MPALPPYIMEPIFEQFLALLPDRVVSGALIGGSPRKGVRPPLFGTDATSGSSLG
jgi:hypothetical protein